MSKEKALKLANLGAAEPESPETHNAARLLAKLIKENPDILEPGTSSDASGNPFEDILERALSEIEATLQNGGEPIQFKKGPSVPGYVQVGTDNNGRPVYAKARKR